MPLNLRKIHLAYNVIILSKIIDVSVSFGRLPHWDRRQLHERNTTYLFGGVKAPWRVSWFHIYHLSILTWNLIWETILRCLLLLVVYKLEFF